MSDPADSALSPPDKAPNLRTLKVAALVLLVIGLVLDLWTKSYMQELTGLVPERPHGDRIEVIEGFLAWEGTWNPGVTFGLAPGKTEIILILTALATVALFIWLLFTRSRSRLLHIGLGMILSGAIGNFYDRREWGKVRDFVLNYVVIGGEEYKWPNYNVADAFIVVGVIFVIWDSLFGYGAKEAKQKALAKKAAERGDAA